MQIAQHMQVSIRQFLTAGDPYSTFPQKFLQYSTLPGSHVWQVDYKVQTAKQKTKKGADCELTIAHGTGRTCFCGAPSRCHLLGPL